MVIEVEEMLKAAPEIAFHSKTEVGHTVKAKLS